MPDTIDSYQKFIEAFNIDKEELYSFGIRETILPPIEKVSQHWEELKKRVFNNGTVRIRGYGRDAKGTHLYTGLYKHLFNNENVKKDGTNNAVPQKIISQLTGYKRNCDLFNYQVSHIFGKTKNIFLFEAPWNIALVPKIIDPFTGHETKGVWPEEYQERFLAYAGEKYAAFIAEYNQLISRPEIIEGMLEYIDGLKKIDGSTKEILQFEKDVMLELTPIGRVADKENKIIEVVKSNSLENTRPLTTNIVINDSGEIYKTLLNLKHEKNRSWVQLRNGCLDLLGLPVSFTTQPVKNTSRAFARDCQRKTGLSYQELLQLLDEHKLGNK